MSEQPDTTGWPAQAEMELRERMTLAEDRVDRAFKLSVCSFLGLLCVLVIVLAARAKASSP